MWRRTTRDRLVVGVLLLATVIVLTLDFRTGVLDGLSGATTQIFSVFQAGVRTVARPIENVIGSIGDLGSLRDRNARLESEVTRLRHENEQFVDVVRENERLKALLRIESTLQLDPVRARVTGTSLTGFERTALLDKGLEDGIEENSAVLAPEGLIGRISWTRARTSRVLLLTDPQSAIGIRIGETGETGLVNGTGGRLLRLELVDRQALEHGAVKQGDLVVTSGLQGGIFPPGLPIGRVEEVSLASRGTAYRILVRPFARLSRLDVVSVADSEESRVAPVPTPTSDDPEDESDGGSDSGT